MSLTLCPECKLEKCLCPVIDSLVAKAQAIDEVTREMGPHIAWKRRLTKYDKRFLRGCGVKP